MSYSEAVFSLTLFLFLLVLFIVVHPSSARWLARIIPIRGILPGFEIPSSYAALTSAGTTWISSPNRGVIRVVSDRYPDNVYAWRCQLMKTGVMELRTL